MRQLFLDIKARIQSFIPGQYVQMFNNQFDLMESGETYSFPVPAIFIEFVNDQPTKQLGGGYQMYDPLQINVHVCHDFYDAQDGTMEQNLDVFDFKQRVYAALQLFEPQGAVAFIRGAETQDVNHTNIYHFTQTFLTNYIDQQQSKPVGGITGGGPFEPVISVTYEESPQLKGK